MDFFGQDDPAADPAETMDPAAKADSARRAPLADRMRPRNFDEWVGQAELVGEGRLLNRLLERDALPSIILWGPPGCGKTTLAGLIARESKMALTKLSAVASGIKEARAVIERARLTAQATGRRTILFIDEIHRFNKAQQDAFLPHVEDGTIILFGATTENPSFSVIAPLLSRCRVLTLKALDAEDLTRILRHAADDEERGLGAGDVEFDDEAITTLAQSCDGDARRALNLLDQCAAAASADDQGRRRVDADLLGQVARREHLIHDRGGEEHFNLISALHKSLRASDVQAALYWLARMLLAGDDPLYLARRLVRFASEDVGLADPQALPQALAGVETYRMLGSPEGELALVQATIYLATCPKSNSLYSAWKAVSDEVGESGSLPTPLHLRNAPTGLMKAGGYGKDYQYDHESPEHFSGQPCLPGEILGREFYKPGALGFEKDIAKRMTWWADRRERLDRESE